jgi:hypothetical protein
MKLVKKLILSILTLSMATAMFGQAAEPEPLAQKRIAELVDLEPEETDKRILSIPEIPPVADTPFVFTQAPATQQAKAAISFTGGGDGVSWNDAANWGGALPGSGDDVTIPSPFSVQLISGANASIQSLTINGSAALTIGSALTLTTSGDITIDAGGALNHNGVINIAGNWNKNGDFNANSGSVVNFNSTSAQNIAASNFADLYLSGNSLKTVTGDLDIDGTLYVTTGSTQLDPGSHTIYVGGAFRNEGTLVLGTGTFFFDGPNWQSVYSNTGGNAQGTWNFNDIQVVGNNGGIAVYDTLSVNGDVYIQSRDYLILRRYNIATPSDGIVNGSGGTLTLEADAFIRVESERTNGPGSTDDNFPSGFNTINMAGGTTPSIVYYRSNNDQIIRSQDGDGDQIDYGRIYIRSSTSGTASTKTLDGDINVTNNMDIGTDQTLEADGYDITIGVNWTNNGDFLPGNGTVTLFRTLSQTISGSRKTTFYNLTISGNNWKYVNRDVDILNELVVESGVLGLQIYDNDVEEDGTAAFTLGNGVILTLNGFDNFPNFTTYNISSTSRVDYARVGDQAMKDGIDYGEVRLLNSGTKSTTIGGTSMTIRGRLYIQGGTTFDIAKSGSPVDLNLYGDFDNLGTLLSDGSTITLLGSTDVNINPRGTATGKPLYNLVVNKTGGKALLQNNLQVDNDLSILNGQFGMETYNRNVFVDGNWTTNAGAEFLHNTGWVYLTGTSQNITANGDGDFYNLSVAGGTKTMLSDVVANGTLLIESDGAFNLNGSNLSIGGNLDNDQGGTFTVTNEQVTFNGSINAYIYTTDDITFYDLVVNKEGGALLQYNNYNMIIGNDLTISSGELRPGGTKSNGQRPCISLTGDFTNNGAFYAVYNDTLRLVGVNQTISGTGTDDISNLHCQGSGIKTITSDFDANRKVIIDNSVTLAVNGTGELIVGREFYNFGTFTANNSTVSFEQYNGTTQYLTSNGSSFYNLNVNMLDPTYDLILNDNLSVTNNITLVQGELNTSGNSYTIDWGGSFDVQDDAALIPANSVFTFDGGGAGTVETAYFGDVSIYSLVVDGAGTTLNLTGDATISEQLLISNGILQTNGNILTVANGSGTDISVTDSLIVDTGAELRLADAATVTINSGGYFGALGSAGDVAVVTHDATGNYGFTVSSGAEIAGDYYTFEFMNTSGIVIASGATINAVSNLSNGTYTNGAAGGTYLAIENNQTLTLNGLSFPSDNGGVNIAKSIDQGAVTIADAAGAFSGPTYENDAFGRINWTYSTTLVTWDGSESTDWNDGNNWSGGLTPTVTDRVSIPSAPANQPLITTTNNAVFQLTIDAGASLTLGNGGSRGYLSVAGDINLNGTLTFANAADTLALEGNWSNTGTFTHNNNGVVLFTGSGNQNINAGGTAAGKTFSHINVFKDGGIAVLAGAIKVDNSVTIADGGLDVSTGNYAIEVAGTWREFGDGDFNPRSGTVTFSTADSLIRGNGDDDFYNLVINASSVTLEGGINVVNDLTIQGGASLDVSTNNYGIVLEGDWVNNGTFTARNGNVVLQGSIQNLNGSSTTTFYHLTLSPTTRVELAVNANVDANFFVTNGQVYLNGFSVAGTGLANIFSISEGVRFEVDGAANFPSGFEAISIDAASDVYYQADGAQSVVGEDSDGDVFAYGNVFLRTAGGTSTKTLTTTINIDGQLNIGNNVTFDLNSNNVSLSGTYVNNNGGSIIPGSGNTFTLDGVNALIYPNTSSGDTFHHFVLANSGYATLYGDLTINGNFTLNTSTDYLNLIANQITGAGGNNTFNLSSDVTLYVRGANNFPTGFESFSLSQASIVRYDGSMDQTITTHDADGDIIEYGDILFYNSTKMLDGDLNARGRFYNAGSATFDVDVANSYDLFLGGNYENPGTVNLYSNTVTFDGPAEQLIYAYGTAASKRFNNIEIDKPIDSYIRFYNYDADIDGNFVFDSGILANHNRNISVAGNWSATSSATMDDRAGIVTLDGVTQTVTAGGLNDFHELVIAVSDSVILGSTVYLLDDLTINSGAVLDVSASNHRLILTGDYTNNGTLEARQGIVEFTGAATQYLYTGGSTAAKRFYKFKINKTSGYVYLRNSLYVEETVMLYGSYNSRLYLESYSITVGGSFYNVGGNYIIPGTSTINFTGTTPDTLTTGYTDATFSRFYNVVINRSDTLYHQDDIRVDNSYNLQAGTVHLNDNNFLFGATFNGNDLFQVSASSADATFLVGPGGQLQARGGNEVRIGNNGFTAALKVIGTADSTAEVSYWANTGYTFRVLSNGELYAQNYQLSYMDIDGIQIDGGLIAPSGPDTVANLSNGTFNNGVTNGRFLLINNDQDLTITDVAFSSAITNGFNVSKPNAAGSITFENATGIFSGDTYEDDPNGLIAWNTTTTSVVWNGSVNSDWHTPGNWNGNEVPDITKNVTIPNVSTDPLISTADALCADITIESGGLLQLGGTRKLTVGGNMVINGTMTVFSNEKVYVAGDFELIGVLNPGTSEFIFNGSSQSLNTINSGIGNRLYSLSISNGSSVILGSEIRALGDITIDAGGSLDVSGSNRSIYVEGSWTNNGTFVYRSGNVFFEGSSAQTVTGTGSSDFYSLRFGNSGVKTLVDSVEVLLDCRVEGGATVNGGTSYLMIRRSFYNYGTFNGQNGTVEFNGTGSSGIYGDAIPTFNNIYFTTGGTKDFYNDINVTGRAELRTGITHVNLVAQTMFGTGATDSLIMEDGTRMYVRSANGFPSGFHGFRMNEGARVDYDADSDQTIRTLDDSGNPIVYPRLNIAHIGLNGKRKTLENGPLYVADQLDLNALDTLDVTSNNYDIHVDGRFNYAGYVLADGAAVTNTIYLTGDETTYLQTPGSGLGKELYNLVIDKDSENFYYLFDDNELVIRNDLTIETGIFNPNGTRDIYIGGSFLVNGGEYSPSAGVLIFNGTGSDSIRTSGSTILEIQLSGTSKTWYLDDALTTSGNITVSAGNTLHLNGNSLSFGNGSDVFTVNGRLTVDAGARLNLYSAASLTVNSGGSFNLVGTSGNIARLGRSSGSGSYGVTINSGGNIAARYYLVEFVNQQGIYVNGGTIDTTNNFSDGVFASGTTNGKMLQLKSNTQDLTGSRALSNVQFTTNPMGTSYNIYVTSSTGSYEFIDASGSFSGEPFEFDPDNKVTWTYTTVTRTWTGTQNTNWHNGLNWLPQDVPGASDDVIIGLKSNMPVISADSAQCRNLSLDGGTLLLQGDNNLNINGNFTIASGASFTVGSAVDTVNLMGNWTNNGNFVNGSGVVVLKGSASQTISTGGTTSGKIFYRLIIDKLLSANVILTDFNLRLDDNIYLLGGSFDASGQDIYAGRGWFNSGATFSPGTGTLIFEGSETDSIQSNSQPLYNLTVNTSGGSVRMLDDLRVQNDLLVAAGVLISGANDISVGQLASNKVSVQGELQVNADGSLQIKGGSQGLLVESGGIVSVIGSGASNLAAITRYGATGGIPLTFNSGAILKANYANFSYTNGTGLWLKSGSSLDMTDKLHYSVFENGFDNSYLHISNSQVLGVITGVTFSSAGQAPTHNIFYDGTGSLRFNNYTGGLSGARYENENGTGYTGNVRWTFTETHSVTAGNSYTFGNDLVITLNTNSDISTITVELVDQKLSVERAYARYYNITTFPTSPAGGYNFDIRQYYADGSNGSSNELVEGSDDLPNSFAKVGSTFQGPFYSSNSSAENWTQADGLTNFLVGRWFISNAESDDALPVELQAFTARAKGAGIVIEWTTASELQNDSWIIERSVSGSDNYTEIARLNGQGTIATETEYSYMDTDIEGGQSYDYQLYSVSYAGMIVLEGTITAQAALAENFRLAQNFPNPFNGSTRISIEIPKRQRVELLVYNVLGQKIRTLHKGTLDQGFYTYTWHGLNNSGSEVASGMYIYVLKGAKERSIKRMLYLK